jgi:hypothetical protein
MSETIIHDGDGIVLVQTYMTGVLTGEVSRRRFVPVEERDALRAENADLRARLEKAEAVVEEISDGFDTEGNVCFWDWRGIHRRLMAWREAKK